MTTVLERLSWEDLFYRVYSLPNETRDIGREMLRVALECHEAAEELRFARDLLEGPWVAARRKMPTHRLVKVPEGAGMMELWGWRWEWYLPRDQDIRAQHLHPYPPFPYAKRLVWFIAALNIRLRNLRALPPPEERDMDLAQAMEDGAASTLGRLERLWVQFMETQQRGRVEFRNCIRDRDRVSGFLGTDAQDSAQATVMVPRRAIRFEVHG